jgi:hypothetical protein
MKVAGRLVVSSTICDLASGNGSSIETGGHCSSLRVPTEALSIEPRVLGAGLALRPSRADASGTCVVKLSTGSIAITLSEDIGSSFNGH